MHWSSWSILRQRGPTLRPPSAKQLRHGRRQQALPATRNCCAEPYKRAAAAFQKDRRMVAERQARETAEREAAERAHAEYERTQREEAKRLDEVRRTAEQNE